MIVFLYLIDKPGEVYDESKKRIPTSRRDGAENPATRAFKNTLRPK
jgi:hypothetical protein